ncbi:Multidrug resistance protein MdtE precursor [Legionella massiliensis]|uniref:Multidrug resistance protein MdtE n=1 Tax=Legionella massiliensis TaxID=1034943 RepID=A0A078L0X6_9GAMM|nr:efflux RND transporter periplasmic adaptor subunit [Legionella massiliensis]CDZ77703.1 Multidrug resistance protein MdtE precursor [Legionella massiliensis]CEE13441.1 Multidrug resistance protein MdtE precursor [Legionella massiliensis]
MVRTYTMFFLFVLLISCEHQKKETAVLNVHASVAHNLPIAERHEFNAEITPRYLTSLSFRVSGLVVERLVENGFTVKKGDTIALLDTVDFQTAVKNAQSQVVAAEFDANQAKSDDVRLSQLKAKGVASIAESERQRTRFDVAHARLLTAQAALIQAQNNLVYSRLVAPFDGVIINLQMEVGRNVRANQSVADFYDPKVMELRADIPETLLSNLSSWTAKMSLWSHPGKVYPVTLRELMPWASEKIKTYQAKYNIAPLSFPLWQGMNAKLILTKMSKAHYLSLPAFALVHQRGQIGVWGIKGDSLFFIPVRVKRYDLNQALVTGVNDGALIVTSGSQKLNPLSKIHITMITP